MPQPGLLVLRGLEGNKPTNLSGLQPFLHAHVTSVELLWLIVFCITLGYVCTRYVLIPIWRRF